MSEVNESGKDTLKDPTRSFSFVKRGDIPSYIMLH